MIDINETYLSLVLARANLNEAWNLLGSLKTNPGVPFAGPAFQYALIAYFRPFNRTKGLTNRDIPPLERSFIPTHFWELHDEIGRARNQIIAHSDFAVRDFGIHKDQLEHEISVVVSQNLITGTELFPRLDDIVMLIEATLENIYAEIARVERQLPVPS